MIRTGTIALWVLASLVGGCRSGSSAQGGHFQAQQPQPSQRTAVVLAENVSSSTEKAPAEKEEADEFQGEPEGVQESELEVPVGGLTYGNVEDDIAPVRGRDEPIPVKTETRRTPRKRTTIPAARETKHTEIRPKIEPVLTRSDFEVQPECRYIRKAETVFYKFPRFDAETLKTTFDEGAVAVFGEKNGFYIVLISGQYDGKDPSSRIYASVQKESLIGADEVADKPPYCAQSGQGCEGITFSPEFCPGIQMQQNGAIPQHE